MNTFTVPVTRAELEASRIRIANDHDVHLVGDYGTAAAHGVSLEFHFDEAAGTLDFTVKSKPFYVSESAIEDAVRGWF